MYYGHKIYLHNKNQVGCKCPYKLFLLWTYSEGPIVTHDLSSHWGFFSSYAIIDMNMHVLMLVVNGNFVVELSVRCIHILQPVFLR